MPPVLIDEEGEPRPITSSRITKRVRLLRPEEDVVACAVSQLGLIHIRPVGRSVIVLLQPRLVGPATMTGAFYEIAELNPERTLIYASEMGGVAELYPGYRLAFKRINSLVAAAGNARAYAGDAVIEGRRR
jgi:hypothetical protein